MPWNIVQDSYHRLPSRYGIAFTNGIHDSLLVRGFIELDIGHDILKKYCEDGKDAGLPNFKDTENSWRRTKWADWKYKISE